MLLNSGLRALTTPRRFSSWIPAGNPEDVTESPALANASPALAKPAKPPAFPDAADAVTVFRLLICVFLALPLMHSPIKPPL